MIHRNAPLTPTGRLRLARCVVEDGWPLHRAAERCVNKWKRYRAVATRYDKRDYIFNGTLTITAIMIWLRDTVQEPPETP